MDNRENLLQEVEGLMERLAGRPELTGLRAVERVLRSTEAEVAVTNPRLEPLCLELDDALNRTEQEIAALGS